MQHSSPVETFYQRLQLRAEQVEAHLEACLADQSRPGEVSRPSRLMTAMRYATLDGGKRFRPFLLIETALMLGAEPGIALPAAAALECVHCYSLVHDDLPAMDDDDLRRGRLTVHKAYDEATAVLVGDSLLTLAFDILSDPTAHPDPLVRCQLVAGLARSAGCGGMAGGQALDLMTHNIELTGDQIRRVQAMKTGALIRYATEAGALLTGVGEADRLSIGEFGRLLGLAFQLGDDLLDETGDTASFGKRAGKDAEIGKATLVALRGVDWARNELEKLVDQASEQIEPYGPAADILIEAAQFLARRKT